MFLFVMTKRYATVEGNFHENKHMQESNGLGVQRLDFALTLIYMALGRDFKSQALLLTIWALWRKDSPWVYR